MNARNAEAEIASDIAEFTHDPLGFVLYAFDWGKGELSEYPDGPESWQRDHLESIGNRLSAGLVTKQQVVQEATASGHGIGKSAVVSWVILWALCTCEDTRGVVTANTENQLKTKTWAELSKWYRLCICKDWFHLTATALYSVDVAHEKTWRIDMVPWSLANTEAFAGLHNRGRRILVIFDEGSAIADQIWEVTEGALTDADTEIVWCVYGNPTRNTGKFFECWGKFKHRWNGKQIDSRSVSITNKEQLNKWVQDYGEDSDFVRVRVRGVFPRTGSNQFISHEDVAACKEYQAVGFETSPKIFGVDVARFGDDQSVVTIRHGRKVLPLIKWRNLDGMQTAARIADLYDQEKPDVIFVDGGGLGGPIVDRVKQLVPKHKVIEVNFGNRPEDPTKYFNKRAEMWGSMRDALKAGMELPEDQELEADLVGPEYHFSPKQQIMLERKEDMKKRGLASPDCGDSLALTYAQKVVSERAPKPKRELNEFEAMGIYSPNSGGSVFG